jgi:O-antigen/teichoic acid export membrane protein
MIKSSFLYAIGSIFQSSIGFIMIPLYISYLTIEQYGLLTILNTILQLTSFVALGGISSAAMRFFHDTSIDFSEKLLYGNATLLLLFFPILSMMILYPILLQISLNFFSTIPFYPYIAIVLFTGIFLPIQKLFVGLLRVSKKPFHFVLFNISSFIFQVIIIYILIVRYDLALNGQLYGRLITNIIFFTIAFLFLIRYSKFSFDLNIIKKLFFFGIPLIPFFVFDWTYSASGRFLIEKYLSLEQVAIFGLSLQFAGIFNLFESALNNALLPHYYETANSNNGSKKIGDLVLRLILFFGILLNFIYLFIKPLFFIVVKDFNYFSALEYVPFFLFVFYLRGIGNVFHMGLLFSKKTKIISLIKSFVLLILLLLSIYLIKKYNSIYVIGLAYLVSNFLFIIITIFISNKYFTIIINWKKLILILFYSFMLYYFFISFSLQNIFYDLIIKIATLSITSLIILSFLKYRIKLK